MDFGTIDIIPAALIILGLFFADKKAAEKAAEKLIESCKTGGINDKRGKDLAAGTFYNHNACAALLAVSAACQRNGGELNVWNQRKFRLKRGGFTRTGNAIFIDEDYETDTLRLTNYKPSSMVLTSPYLFALKLVSEGKELAYPYFADAGSWKMDCEKGWAQFAMTDNEQVRFRGKGVTLRIELSPAIKTDGTKACDGVYTRPDGSIEGVFDLR